MMALGERVLVPDNLTWLTVPDKGGVVIERSAWDGYWLIELDHPAIDEEGNEVPVVVISEDNLETFDERR